MTQRLCLGKRVTSPPQRGNLRKRAVSTWEGANYPGENSTDGYIEVLPMPTDEHQTMLAYLYQVFFGFLQGVGGQVLFAPLRLRIRARKFREPDLLLVRHADAPRRQKTITILRLAQHTYIEYGVFRRGAHAPSLLLDGFTVQVDAVFDTE